MNDETLVNSSQISVNSTYQKYEGNDVDKIRPKNQGQGTKKNFSTWLFNFLPCTD